MGLSVKAITLLFCCVMMTLQYRAQQKQRTVNDTQPPPSASSSSAFPSFSSNPTFYSALELPKTATPAQIKAAHRRLAIRYHPDKLLAAQCQPSASPSSTSSPSASTSPHAPAHERFICIQEAYEVLSDPYERRRYDFALITGTQYHRLSQTLKTERKAAGEEKQRTTDFSTLSALYRRKRPAAFTPTGSAYKAGDDSSTSASTTASGAASSTAATPPPASAASFRPSRSFSSLLFTADSPAPTTGGESSRTSSPHSHSPATSPYTPASPSSLSLSNPPTVSHSPAQSTSHSSPSLFASLISRLRPSFAAHLRLVAFLRWCSLALWMFVSLPVRLLLALSIVARQRRRREMEEEAREQAMRKKAEGGAGGEGSRIMETAAVR